MISNNCNLRPKADSQFISRPWMWPIAFRVRYDMHYVMSYVMSYVLRYERRYVIHKFVALRCKTLLLMMKGCIYAKSCDLTKLSYFVRQLPQSSATPTNLPFEQNDLNVLSNSSLKLVYKSVKECERVTKIQKYLLLRIKKWPWVSTQTNWGLCTGMQEHTTFDLLHLMPYLEMTLREEEFVSEKCI